jgi:hypothetical protein
MKMIGTRGKEGGRRKGEESYRKRKERRTITT